MMSGVMWLLAIDHPPATGVGRVVLSFYVFRLHDGFFMSISMANAEVVKEEEKRPYTDEGLW